MVVAAVIADAAVGRPGDLHGRDRAAAGRRSITQPAMEVFVGIPSVVWGWLGLTILVPFLRENFRWARLHARVQLVRRVARPRR